VLFPKPDVREETELRKYGIILLDPLLKEGSRSPEVAMRKNLLLAASRHDFFSVCPLPQQYDANIGIDAKADGAPQ
jgi:hypothetical protein